MLIKELARKTLENSKEKGFEPSYWITPLATNLDQKLMLIVRELGEAHEELRDGHNPTKVWYGLNNKPEGFGVEMADVVIRVMDVCEALGIDLEERILEKMAFNQTRPTKHGKQF